MWMKENASIAWLMNTARGKRDMEMKKEELDRIIANHVKWLRGDGGKRADLREANLAGVNLEVTNLVKSDLREANLSGANLRSADLSGACLCRVNLRKADLNFAYLHGADLRRADIHETNLEGARLEGANLPTGVYQIVGAGSCNRCTTYDSINDRVICGCWSDGEGNHLNSFVKRIEEIYGAEGEEPNLEFYQEYMAAIAFFKAIKELRERYLKEGKDDGQDT